MPRHSEDVAVNTAVWGLGYWWQQRENTAAGLHWTIPRLIL